MNLSYLLQFKEVSLPIIFSLVVTLSTYLIFDITNDLIILLIFCSSILIFRTASSWIKELNKKKLLNESRHLIKIFPIDHECFWVAAQQKDGSFATQIAIGFDASNISSKSLRMMEPKLIKPRAKVEYSNCVIKSGHLHDRQYPINPFSTTHGSFTFLIHGQLAKRGSRLKVKIKITDQTGFVQFLKLNLKSR